MKYSAILLLAWLGLFSCNQNDPGKHRGAFSQARLDSLKDEVLNTDIAFSQMSEEKGRNAAFVEYAADNATLLGPFSMPATGLDTIKALLNRHPDSGYVLTWVPIRADVARSGDLAYTYGTYSLDIKNIGKEDGTYCTIWKREKGKTWKFVLDTGNEGLQRSEEAKNKVIKEEVKKVMKKEEAKKK